MKAQLSLFSYYGSEQCFGRLAVDYLPYSFLPFIENLFQEHMFAFYANNSNSFFHICKLAKYSIAALRPYVSAMKALTCIFPFRT